jgi:hypothetical protein
MFPNSLKNEKKKRKHVIKKKQRLLKRAVKIVMMTFQKNLKETKRRKD